MKFKNLIILGLVLLSFTYCSSDDLMDGQKPGTEEATGVKMQVTIGMPTTRTRTGTDGATKDDGTLGTTEEAKVNKVLIAIYDTNHNLVTTHTSTVADSPVDNKATSETGKYVTEQFTINSLKVGSKYHVYAFANPYEGLDALLLSKSYKEGAFPKDKHDTFAATIAAVTKNGTTQDNFFMSNATTSKAVEVEQKHVLDAPLEVELNVERAVARFDASLGTGSFTLPVASTVTGYGTTVSVVITDYKLMNNSKSFFNLKRVIKDAATTIGGAETVYNYVVDTDWGTKAKNKTDGTVADWTASFHSYMGSVTDATNLTPYNKIADKAYATENTIPSEAENIKGVATAIVFKGDLVFTGSTSTDLTEDVYVWNNQFYGVFENLPAGIQAIGEANKAALASAGVTAYSKVGDVYPIYYVYYNAHNQSDAQKKETTVGPMEFGVVRNNIYTLKVNSITKFGHPNDPELVYTPGTSNPDPNPENPKDPIKSSDLYMQVTATVNPWTVRTNVIDF